MLGRGERRGSESDRVWGRYYSIIELGTDRGAVIVSEAETNVTSRCRRRKNCPKAEDVATKSILEIIRHSISLGRVSVLSAQPLFAS